MAKAAGMNYFQLNRKLHSNLNKNTSQYIREIRLERAKEILEKEEITAAEVAYKTGFGSPAYFSRCFHEYFGYPPGETKSRKNIDSELKNEFNKHSVEAENPVQKKPARKIVVYAAGGILFLLMVYLLFNNLSFQNFSLLPAKQLTSEEKSIAVLPFKNLSNDPNNQYFADGVMEDIMNHLYQIGEIRLISRTSVEQFRRNTNSTPEIAKKLGVNFILEGSVLQYEGKVRVMVKLIDARLDKYILTEQYDRDFEDIFNIQSDIAKLVASQLQTVLSNKEIERIEKIPTRNMEAYSNYSKGRYLLNLRREGDIKIIVDCFEKAIAADPHFAEAYANLAETYWLYTNWRFYPRPEGFIKAEEFALKALQLDSNLAETHTIMGCLLCTDYKWEEARKEFEHAIRLNPNSATARQYYSDFLEIINQRQEARAQIEIAKNLNPVSPMAYYRSANLYLHEEKYKDALDECDKVVELDPRNTSIYWRYFNIYLQMGDEPKAVEALQKAHSLYPEDESYVPLIKEVYNKDGMKGVLQFEIELNLKDPVNVSQGIAINYMRLGEKEKALDYLEMTYKLRYLHLPSNMYSPVFKNLINEPRFQALLDSMNLIPYQATEINSIVLKK
ncbi:helix-turn-helix domain-containing protein [Mariniphaga sp.]|uniref:helix-turn-helix domain-containing protein n=1 Tax=Mariniphaga sp. TaxID=1954475 RepID=UPI003569A877